MTESQIQADMQFLAGRLAHRGANTDNERTAAQYVCDRLREYCPDAAMDDFYSPDNPRYLFASYYAEFAAVALVAHWWPRLALCYGAVVLMAYLAEFMGFRVMGRFVPQYETQNVVAPILSERPSRMFVIMAHYDSGKAGPLSRARVAPWMRTAQVATVLCMVTILATCANQALNTLPGDQALYNTFVRWGAVAYLLVAAGTLSYREGKSEYIRGANDNASGVAALLRLARQLSDDPIPGVDVHLVATGSNQTWMNGARHFVKGHLFDRDTTYFLDLDNVGAGRLAYTTSAGILHMTRCSKRMCDAASGVAQPFDAIPHALHTLCSDVLIPLARGLKAMEITAIAPDSDAPGGPRVRDAAPTGDALRVPDPPRARDTLDEVDPATVYRAAAFAEAVLRRLAADTGP